MVPAATARRQRDAARPMIRFLRHKGGASAVEFALVAPVLIALLFGTVEIGQLYWARNSLEFAAEEASRYVLANPAATQAQITSAALGKLTGVDPSTVTVTGRRPSAFR